MPVRLHVMRTLYPRWGKYSGFHQYLKHLDPAHFQITMKLVSDNDDDFPIDNQALRLMLRTALQKRGMPWYKLSDLAGEFKTLPSCLAGRLDIVHFFDGEHTARYLPMMLRRWPFSRTRTIASFHQVPELLQKLVDPRIVARLDAVNLVSPDQLEFFRAFLPEDRISVLLHGIDTDHFRPADSMTDDARIRCLTTGYWRRDWATIRTVAKRLEHRRDIEFHIVTDAETGLEGAPNVTMYKNISDELLLSVYQRAQILFFPLLDATANNSLLEGLACGLPVISTALASLRAYLRGDEAILIEDNDPDDLTEALVSLAGDPERRRRMSASARSRALELDWRCIARQHEKVYNTLVARAK